MMPAFKSAIESLERNNGNVSDRTNFGFIGDLSVGVGQAANKNVSLRTEAPVERKPRIRKPRISGTATALIFAF